MKKLLSLLSVLTISGTAMPNVIAASPYKKEENIDSTINYSQTKNLNRNKRDNEKIDELVWKKISDNIFISKKIILKKRQKNDNFDNKFKRKFKKSGNFFWGNLFKKFSNLSFVIEKLDSEIDLNKMVASKYNWSLFFIKNNKLYNLEIANSPAPGIPIGVYNYKDKKEITFFNDKDIENLFSLKEEIYVISKNGKVYEHNVINKKNRLFFDINTSFDGFNYYDDHFSIFNKNNEIYEYFFIESLNNNYVINLLNEWQKHFDNWKNKFNRQLKEDVPEFGDDERGKALKRTWKDEKIVELQFKIHSLHQDLNIIKNHDEINKINDIILTLKDEINKIYDKISKYENKISEITKELNKNQSDTCETDDLLGDINDVFSPIPVFSTITASLKSITTISCKIFKL